VILGVMCCWLGTGEGDRSSGRGGDEVIAPEPGRGVRENGCLTLPSQTHLLLRPPLGMLPEDSSHRMYRGERQGGSFEASASAREAASTMDNLLTVYFPHYRQVSTCQMARSVREVRPQRWPQGLQYFCGSKRKKGVMRMKYLLAILAVALTSVLVACSSSDNSSSGTPTTAPSTSPAASSSASANTVDVVLREWSITPSVLTAKAGSVTFNARNNGPKEEHEFVILKTDLAPADLPKRDNGSVDEEGAGITSPGEIEGISPGDQKTATFDLTPGKYIFICNLIEADEVHFSEGMFAQFTVQ
jgi:uncharacterized cupredoxin-like copper-binding protein